MQSQHHQDSEKSPRTAVKRRPYGWLALLRQRCPRCRLGPIFRGLFDMHQHCPLCELSFQRDAGYFLGAMYVSYPISAVLLTGGYFLGRELLPSWDPSLVFLLIVLPCYLPLVPLVYRYARVLWIYFDRWNEPGETSSSVGWEQWREQHPERFRAE
ncbi:MAG: DUF983 domain-containing protein [Planctomycetia bacterium]|nr:DUF983 domain-containing protein [Planctomycetia bacterium]